MRTPACCLLLSLAACSSDPAPPIGAHFSDNFDRKEIGQDWWASGGQWRVVGGQMESVGAYNSPVFLKRSLPADVVVELDVYSETQKADSKIELMTDGLEHESGYVFIYGGWDNKTSAIAKRDEHSRIRAEKSPSGAAGKRWNRWRIEKRGGQLRWFVNGQLYLSYEDPAPLSGPGHDRLAFNNWDNYLRFDNLQIWPADKAPALRAPQ